MRTVTFGYAGKWTPDYAAAQQAAYLVKSDPTPVGVEGIPGPTGLPSLYRVTTNNDYYQAVQAGRLVWTSLA